MYIKPQSKRLRAIDANPKAHLCHNEPRKKQHLKLHLPQDALFFPGVSVEEKSVRKAPRNCEAEPGQGRKKRESSVRYQKGLSKIRYRSQSVKCNRTLWTGLLQFNNPPQIHNKSQQEEEKSLGIGLLN